MKDYHFSSLQCRVDRGLKFIDDLFPPRHVFDWIAGITEEQISDLKISSNNKDILAIVFGGTFQQNIVDLDSYIGEAHLCGFAPESDDNFEAEAKELDRLWRIALRQRKRECSCG